MPSHKGSLTIQEGALTPVFLIEKPFQLTEEDQGEFYYLKEKIQIVSWSYLLHKLSNITL